MYFFFLPKIQEPDASKLLHGACNITSCCSSALNYDAGQFFVSNWSCMTMHPCMVKIHVIRGINACLFLCVCVCVYFKWQKLAQSNQSLWLCSRCIHVQFKIHECNAFDPSIINVWINSHSSKHHYTSAANNIAGWSEIRLYLFQDVLDHVYLRWFFFL